jgi:hypothetical protein
MRRASAVLCLPLFQEDWREAVRSFVGAEKRKVFAIEVSIAKPGGPIIAFDSWTKSERTAADLAEGIAEWTELHSEGVTEDLEATISVCAPASTPPATDIRRTGRLRAVSIRRFEQLGCGIRILATQTQRMILYNWGGWDN